MRILPYYIIHTFINSIKKLFKTWVAVFLAVCFGFGILFGVGAAVIGNVIEDSVDSSYEETADQEVFQENTVDEYAEEYAMSDEEKALIFAYIRGGIILVSFLVILFSIYGGDKGGSKIFTMPDVNFLFASPLKPQSVLMFKTVLQMGIAIISSLYLLFQLPNLVLNVGLSIVTCLCIFVAFGFLLYLSRLASVVTYTVASTHLKVKPYIRTFVVTAIGIIIALFAGFIYIGKMNFTEVFSLLFSSEKVNFLPIFGWLSGLVMSGINNDISAFVFYFVILCVSSVLLTMLIWKIKADFYEDALSSATELQETLNAAQERTSKKRKKDRSEKVMRNSEFKNVGATVFFEKTLYNRRRFAKLGILSNTAITYLLTAAATTLGVKLLFKAETVIPVGFILFAFIFFRNLGNPLADEMTHDFLFTVPESPYKKLWYCMLGSSTETALDLIPAFVLTVAVMPHQLLWIVLWFIVWVSLDFFCSAVGVFVDLVIPTAVVPTIKAMFSLCIRMFAVVPAIILAITAAVINTPLILLIIFTINILIGGILSFISPVFLHSGRK